MNKFTTSKDPKMVTSNNDDFSFPIIPNPLASFMLSSSSPSSSSSLWRISSRVFHHQEEEKDCQIEVQSMCDEGCLSMNKGDTEWSSCHGEELDVEERMDCLWEDFNEEEKRFSSSEVHFVRESCELPKKQPRISRRHSKIVVMGRLLKRLVSIRKSTQQKIFKA